MKKSWKILPQNFPSFFIMSLLVWLSAFSGWAEKSYRANEAPHPLKDVAIKENLGQALDLNLRFTDEKGQSQALKKYFKQEPVLMTIVYYNCPSLCNFHLNGLFQGLEKLSYSWKKTYQLLIVSMDPREKPALASEKKANYLKRFKNLKSEKTHFLTSSQDSIKKLSDRLGFSFRWDKETSQFAHSPVAYALSPKGIISRYLYGVVFQPKTLKLSLLEAGKGKVGNIIDRFLLFCYRFNPKENKYSLYAVNIMKAGGLLIILALMSLLIPAWIKERNQNT